MNAETIFRHYTIAALWSSTDDEGEPLDVTYSTSDLAPDTLDSMRLDVVTFVGAAGELLEQSGLSDSQIGHDLWLTRCRHGDGFWDRGIGDTGDKLTALCHAMGEVDLYVGDDDLIHAL
jgi:hypothetical protein